MLKKIMLVVVAAVFLIGTESLFAADRKKAEPTQRQGARAPQQQKSQTLQVARQKAAREAQAKRAEEMRKKRQQEAMQKKRQQEAASKAQALRGTKQQEAAKKKSATQSRVSRRPQQSRTGQNLLPMQQVFGKWLDEMNKAYRDNDRQKMGQLLRRMQQLTQRVQQAGTTAGQRWQQFRDGRTGIERPRTGLSISPRGMWGCGRGRCMMGRGGPGF